MAGLELPFFKFYAAETLSDERFQVRWGIEERGAWITLMAHGWREGSIPADLDQLARIVGVDGNRMRSLWPALADRWQPHPTLTNRLVCPRQEEERAEALGARSARIEAGKKGAKSRWFVDASSDGNRMAEPQADACGRDSNKKQIQKQKQINNRACAREGSSTTAAPDLEPAAGAPVSPPSPPPPVAEPTPPPPPPAAPSPAEDVIPRRPLLVEDVAGEQPPSAPTWPRTAEFRQALANRHARTALHSVGGGSGFKNQPEVFQSVEASLQVIPIPEAVELCFQATREQLQRGGRQPWTLAWFAQLLASEVTARRMAPAKRAPGECPKPGDPDFNDQAAWPDVNAFFAREGPALPVPEPGARVRRVKP